MKRLNRKGVEFAWSKIASIILVLLLLVVLIFGFNTLRELMVDLWHRASGFLRFGAK